MTIAQNGDKRSVVCDGCMGSDYSRKREIMLLLNDRSP